MIETHSNASPPDSWQESAKHVSRFRLCPECASRVADLAAAAITRDFPAVNALAAPTTSLLGLTSRVADRLRFPMVYVRSEAKVHGKQRQVEGQLPTDSIVGIIDSREIDQALRTASVLALAASGYERVTWLPFFGPDSAGESSACIHSASERPFASRASFLGDQGLDPRFTRASERAIIVAEALLSIEAVSVRPDPPFRYASGMLSPIYTDNRLLISHPVEWRNVIDGFVAAITSAVTVRQVSDFDALVGMSTSGIPHATLLGDRLGMPSFASDDLEAATVFAGKRVAMIEDHITTGGSVLKAIESLHQIGVKTVACFAIFNYGRKEAMANFRNVDVPLISLCNLDTLLDTAIRNGSLTWQDADAVNDWLKDPTGWAERSEARIVGAGTASP
ncbi:MAG: hypothetical protein EPO26_13015 [Chloroflexota bacterium]|nr:MAG: hypothetical protein EPO26_13015 [Chloroflexota bacterium]